MKPVLIKNHNTNSIISRTDHFCKEKLPQKLANIIHAFLKKISPNVRVESFHRNAELHLANFFDKNIESQVDAFKKFSDDIQHFNHIASTCEQLQLHLSLKTIGNSARSDNDVVCIVVKDQQKNLFTMSIAMPESYEQKLTFLKCVGAFPNGTFPDLILRHTSVEDNFNIIIKNNNTEHPLFSESVNVEVIPDNLLTSDELMRKNLKALGSKYTSYFAIKPLSLATDLINQISELLKNPPSDSQLLKHNVPVDNLRRITTGLHLVAKSGNEQQKVMATDICNLRVGLSTFLQCGNLKTIDELMVSGESSLKLTNELLNALNSVQKLRNSLRDEYAQGSTGQQPSEIPVDQVTIRKSWKQEKEVKPGIVDNPGKLTTHTDNNLIPVRSMPYEQLREQWENS